MGGARIRMWDWAIAVGVAAILVLAGHADGGLDATRFALLAAGGLALAARRRAPIIVLLIAGCCAVGYRAAGLNVFAVAYLVAVYAAVRAGHRVATIATSVAMLIALPLSAMASGLPTGAALVQARDVLELAWLIAAGAAGEALRQAEQRADEAERTREEAALRRAGDERLHIARELHDSLTHQISVIKVQAEAAVHLAHKRGQPIPPALLAIRDAGREAARELRATLEALRDDDTTPPPGLDQVAELVERAKAAGVDASLTVDGHRTDVPTAVQSAAYRIVQEALTNVARHAAAAPTTVQIGYRTDTIVIQVEDSGSADPQPPTHHPAQPGVGLLGMRERVTALGGRLRAEPRRQGGFTVHAELPVAPAS
jgi:signal transduction histidine kinase